MLVSVMFLEKKKSDLTEHEVFITVLKELLAGGIAGCVAKTTVAPLDRVKILLQGHNHHYHHLGVISSLQHIKLKEGLSGWYQGNGIHMIRVFPYAAIQYTAYETYKKKLGHYVTNHPRYVSFVSGSLAGLTAVILTYPLDIVRCRITFQVKGELIYTGCQDAVKAIYKEGGFQAMYKGIVPSLLGMALYGGISFYTFELLKTTALENYSESFGECSPTDSQKLILTLPAKLMCGAAAGIMAQTFCYPLDVVRRKMQLSGMYQTNTIKRSWYHLMADVYRSYGIQKGLYRGLSINYMRALPMTSVSFAVYENCKQAFGLDTGVKR